MVIGRLRRGALAGLSWDQLLEDWHSSMIDAAMSQHKHSACFGCGAMISKRLRSPTHQSRVLAQSSNVRRQHALIASNSCPPRRAINSNKFFDARFGSWSNVPVSC